MPDIIIHGASGFIGKHFLRKLISEKFRVTILARASSDIQEFEKSNLVTVVRYKNSLAEIDPNSIQTISPVFFEFAWYGVFGTERNDEQQLSVNIPMIRASVQLADSLKAIHWAGIGSQDRKSVV